MKKFLSKTPVTQVLLILFCTLLLFILIARAVEFKGLENTESALSNTTQKSLQRQQIFTSMLNGSDDIRINTLNYLFYLNKNGKILAQEKINKTISSNEQLRLQYQQLIEDAEEQKLFDTVHLFETFGFNVDQVRSGIGLANMKRRAELFAGTFQIESMPGNGSEILVTIPLNELN